MDKLSLLAVYAHPDDEAYGSAGTLAKYARQGVMVSLISASRGEAGEISPVLRATQSTLGALREAELRESCRVIGIADLRFLDCIDGGVQNCPTGQAVGRIVSAIRELRPQVVITFGPEGIYGHPDHVAVHHFALAACDQAANTQVFPEQLIAGLRPYAPTKVYFRVIPKQQMPQLAGLFEEIRRNLGLTGEDIESFFAPDDEVTTAIDATEYLEIKRQAIASHRSQVGDEPFAGQTPEVVRADLAIEYYRLRNCVHRPGDPYETDLFAGLY